MNSIHAARASLRFSGSKPDPGSKLIAAVPVGRKSRTQGHTTRDLNMLWVIPMGWGPPATGTHTCHLSPLVSAQFLGQLSRMAQVSPGLEWHSPRKAAGTGAEVAE